LALKDQFEAHAGKRIAVEVIDRDASDASKQLLDRLAASEAFELKPVSNDARSRNPMFLLTIEQGFAAQLGSPEEDAPATVTLDVAADVAKQTQLVVSAAIREALGRQSVDGLVTALRTMMQAMSPQTAPAAETGPQLDQRLFQVRYDYGGGTAPPTSVQQNVPAWLVFALFFVVIPVSTAVIRERQVGTLRRIRTTRASNLTLLLGKLIPYYAVNQLQVVVMLLVGVYIVPLLGGDALALNGSFLALFVIASATSVAALGYALLIAVIVKTTEQATIVGGAGNIVLAAIGGIMVPKFVMPEAMQTLTNFSPLAWGLEGFLDVLLRDGKLSSVLGESAALTALGAGLLILASALQARARD
jgi:ABC-2 type transport system permease protein